MIINYDYKNLRENLFNLKRFFENLGKLIKIKSRSCIENLFNFIFFWLVRKAAPILFFMRVRAANNHDQMSAGSEKIGLSFQTF